MTLEQLLLLVLAILIYALVIEQVTTGIKNVNVLGLRLKTWGFHIALAIAVGVALAFNVDLTKSLEGPFADLDPKLAEILSGVLVAWVSNRVHDRYRDREPTEVAVAPKLLAGKPGDASG